MGYSVILPTLNEAGNIIKLVNDIIFVLDKTKKEFEIIIVDDNSKDSTPELCQILTNKYPNVNFHSRQKEKRNLAESLNLGVEKSKFENIIWLDADYQHPPEYIKEFDKFIDKNDVIIFSRFLKDSKRYFENDKFKKEVNENQSVFFNKLCNKLLYKDITDYTSGFICIKKKILNQYKLKGYYGEYFISLITYCRLKKFSILELPFTEKARYSGISKTYPEFSLKYIILLYMYLICLIKILIKKFLKF